jgi:type II secretory pathway pseudopilin PulG
MNKHIRKISSRSAMTLTEIILAMALLASAFIPIIGVMGSSMKVTEKDNRTIRAVNLCQEKMNQALQFPFGILEKDANPTKVYGQNSPEVIQSSTGANKIILTLGPEEIDGFEFRAELKVQDRPGTFVVPMYDPFEKAKPANRNDPSKWGWSEETIAYNKMYYQYTMTIFWSDKGDSQQKEYSLSSFKSKVRE